MFYDWRCRFPTGWFKVGKASLIGPNQIHDVMYKVHLTRQRLKTTQSYQKSCADCVENRA